MSLTEILPAALAALVLAACSATETPEAKAAAAPEEPREAAEELEKATFEATDNIQEATVPASEFRGMPAEQTDNEASEEDDDPRR